MSTRTLGSVLIVANPASRSGAGLEAARRVGRLFDVYRNVASEVRLELTKGPGDATRLARGSRRFDTLIALGGDGLIHEVANGLMALEKPDRPTLALVPIGSGNDFARTLGQTFDDPDRSVAEILSSAGGMRAIDVGRVTSDADPAGTFFVETLSFGLDAAIALDTTERRARDTRERGAALFVTSGISIMARSHEGWTYEATVGSRRFSGTDLVFAVQNGPTYGGGFRICPDARPDDGRLDFCFTTRKPGMPVTLATFARARGGHHVNSRWLTFCQAAEAEISFDEEPPCQVDGERLRGRRFSISTVPEALRVIVPAGCPW